MTLVWGALLGAILGPLVNELWQWFTSRKQEFSGMWLQEVPADADRPLRRDIVVCRQRGAKLTGKIIRAAPHDERRKRWQFRGHASGNDVVAAFWPRTSHPDQSSFGSIVLHRSSAAAASRWSGVYFRPGSDLGKGSAAEPNLAPLPLTWTRFEKPWYRGLRHACRQARRHD